MPSIATARTAYVAVQGSNAVARIDLATATAGTSIAVGAAPQGIAFTPDGATAFVTNAGANTVQRIDVATGTVGATIAVGNQPFAVAITPDGTIAYVSNFGSSSVTAINVATGAVLASMLVGANPQGIAFSPDGATAYVAAGAAVRVISVATHTPGPVIIVGGAPRGVAITPDGTTVWVAVSGANQFTPVDTATNTVGVPVAVAGTPFGVAITPDGATAYVTRSTLASVVPINLATRVVGAPIAVGASPFAVAFSPSGSTAYVTNNGSANVTPINVAAGVAGSAIAVGPGPLGVAFVPDQAPTARVTASAVQAGSATSFDASTSTDPDGTIASYVFDFGDGTSATSSTPVVSHAYAAAGSYSATVTVTDDEGCSTLRSFTGQSVSCNGSATARTTVPVVVSTVVPVVVVPPGAIAPVVTTSSASTITASSATLQGSVNPGGASTTYSFEYGTSTAYGSITRAQSAGSGSAAVTASARIGGLRGSTVYHYRLVATNAGGTVAGADRTFRTSAARLVISSSPRVIVAERRSCITFTVSAQGSRVARATVRFAGRTLRTSSNGTVRTCVTLAAGLRTARASGSGFIFGITRVVVLPASPRPDFTG